MLQELNIRHFIENGDIRHLEIDLFDMSIKVCLKKLCKWEKKNTHYVFFFVSVECLQAQKNHLEQSGHFCKT